MRQIFSVRFFAAVGGVVGLFFLLTTIFATRDVIVGGDGDADGVELHRIDFVEQIESSTNRQFSLTIEGVAANDTELVIDESRRLLIVEDTPGVNLCPRFPAPDACAVLADLLGEGVVWFALVPAGPNRTVDLPAIDTLDDGVATLVNGWQVPFAPVLDRRCRNEEFTSYREFRDVLADDFTSIFGLDDRRLIAVECRTRVDYAPEVSPSESDAEGSVPVPAGGEGERAERAAEIRAALVGVGIDEAVVALETVGWTVRVVDVDDPPAAQTLDVRADRATLEHRDGLVVDADVG